MFFRIRTPDVEMNWITSGEISPRQLENAAALKYSLRNVLYGTIAKQMDCSTSGVVFFFFTNGNFQEMNHKSRFVSSPTAAKKDLIRSGNWESKLIVTHADNNNRSLFFIRTEENFY